MHGRGRLMLALLLLACHPGSVPIGDTGPQAGGQDTDDTGVGEHGTLSVSPTSLDLGPTPWGCSEEAQVTLRNAGNAPLTINSAAIESGGELSLDEAGPWELAPTEQIDLVLRFTPGSEGSGSAVLVVSSDGGEGRVDITTEATAGPLYEERHQVEDPDRADIVIAVDRSASMSDELDALARDFATLTDALEGAGLDYHLAIVGQDDGCVRGETPFLVPGDPDPSAVAADMIDGEPGGATHAALTLLQASLDAEDCDGDLYRDDAAWHLVGVSDQPEQSALPYTAYVSDFTQRRDQPDSVRVHAIGGPAPSGCEDALYYDGMDQAVGATGGSFFSVCDPMDEVLAGLGQAIIDEAAVRADKAQRWTLAAPAVPGSVTVTLDGEAVDGWALDSDGQTVLLDERPPSGTTLGISYTQTLECDGLDASLLAPPAEFDLARFFTVEPDRGLHWERDDSFVLDDFTVPSIYVRADGVFVMLATANGQDPTCRWALTSEDGLTWTPEDEPLLCPADFGLEGFVEDAAIVYQRDGSYVLLADLTDKVMGSDEPATWHRMYRATSTDGWNFACDEDCFFEGTTEDDGLVSVPGPIPLADWSQLLYYVGDLYDVDRGNGIRVARMDGDSPPQVLVDHDLLSTSEVDPLPVYEEGGGLRLYHTHSPDQGPGVAWTTDGLNLLDDTLLVPADPASCGGDQAGECLLDPAFLHLDDGSLWLYHTWWTTDEEGRQRFQIGRFMATD